MAAYEYSLADVIATVDASGLGLGIHIVEGFGDSAIQGSRSEDGNSLRNSADGKVQTFVRNPKRHGMVTFVLDEHAPSNAFFQALREYDETQGRAVVAIKVTDHSGNEEINVSKAKLQKAPAGDKGAEAGNRTYAFLAADYEPVHSGGTQL